MSVRFPIDVVDKDDASGTRENQAAQEEPNVSTGATQSPFTSQAEPNESTGAAQSSFTATKGETHQSQKKGNCFKASSSKVNEKGRCKKRKTVEDDNETVLKGLMEVMKQFTESHDNRMSSLIDNLGERVYLKFVVRYFLLLDPLHMKYTTQMNELRQQWELLKI